MSNSVWGEIFHTCLDQPWDPPSYTIGTGSLPQVKQLGPGVDHPSPSSVEVKGRVQLYLLTPSGPSWPVLGWALALPLPLFHELRNNSSTPWNRIPLGTLIVSQLNKKFFSIYGIRKCDVGFTVHRSWQLYWDTAICYIYFIFNIVIFSVPVSGTSRCLFSDKYKTHKYGVGRAYICWMLNWWCIAYPVGFERLIPYQIQKAYLISMIN